MWTLLLLLAAEQDWLGAHFRRELTAKAEAECGRTFRVPLGKEPPVRAIRGLVGGEDGKEIYVHFLKERYGYNIARVNEVYGREATSFTELLTDSFRDVDERRGKVVEDDAAFGEVLRAHWTEAADAGGRRCGAKGVPVVELEDQGLVVTWRTIRVRPAQKGVERVL